MTSPATPTPKPTLFISYASEDREAARRLRDTLAAAGLDVWYDENELGGGDSWDAKIRRQIRECDYFMPVISANTERRKEGYFRREWRLAVERTLDMADDVMFLLPVCIDGTTENNARVPEKFFTVQWLRVPAGTATPALEHLARRLATGEHLAPLPPRGRTEPPISRAHAPAAAPDAPPPLPHGAGPPTPPPAHDAAHDGPPPMPPFPHHTGDGIGPLFKFFAEIIWWIITAAWLLMRRAPKWARALIIIWICFTFFSYCTRNRTPPPAGKAPAEKSEKRAKPQITAADLTAAQKALKDSGLPAGLAEFGNEVAKRLAAEIKNSEAADKQIVAVPFASGVTDPVDTKFLTDVFTPLWGRLAIERAGETGLITTPLPAPSNDALLALGKKLDATYVLGARLVSTSAPAAPAAPATPATTENAPPVTAPGASSLEVVLLHVADSRVAWSATFPVRDADATAVANNVAEAVLASTKAK